MLNVVTMWNDFIVWIQEFYNNYINPHSNWYLLGLLILIILLAIYLAVIGNQNNKFKKYFRKKK